MEKRLYSGYFHASPEIILQYFYGSINKMDFTNKLTASTYEDLSKPSLLRTFTELINFAESIEKSIPGMIY